MDDPHRAVRLKTALDQLTEADGFEYVFVDCPPSLGILTVNGLTAADRVLVPLQCEYYALEGLTHLMATIDRVKNGTNPELEVEGILLTMFDARNNLSHQVAEEVQRHFRVFESVIPRNVRLWRPRPTASRRCSTTCSRAGRRPTWPSPTSCSPATPRASSAPA